MRSDGHAHSLVKEEVVEEHRLVNDGCETKGGDRRDIFVLVVVLPGTKVEANHLGKSSMGVSYLGENFWKEGRRTL